MTNNYQLHVPFVTYKPITASEMDLQSRLFKSKLELENRGLGHGIRSEIDSTISSLDDFVSIYYSVFKLLDDKNMFAKEGSNRRSIARMLSANTAANAVMNKMKSGDISNFLHEDGYLVMNRLKPKKLLEMSDISLLSTVVSDISNDFSKQAAHNFDLTRINIFNYFSSLRSATCSAIDTLCSRETKENEIGPIDFVIPRFDTSYKQFRKPDMPIEKKVARPGVGQNSGYTLPKYDPNNFSKISDIIWDRQALGTIGDMIVKALCYIPSTKMNAWQNSGFGVIDSMFLFGEPGVGKNYMADAVINYAKSLADKYSKPIQFVRFSQSLSKMQDEPALLIDNYFLREEEGDKIYINVFEELSGIFPVDSRGGDSDHVVAKITRFLEHTGNGKNKGNILNIALDNTSNLDRINVAMWDRFFHIQLLGPQTSSDYAAFMRNGIRKIQIPELINPSINWGGIGEYLLTFKKNLFPNDDPLRLIRMRENDMAQGCRHLSRIISSIKDYKDGDLMKNSHIVGYSYEKLQHEIHSKFIGEITEEKIYNAINVYFGINKESGQAH